jgi:hypothetical protein
MSTNQFENSRISEGALRTRAQRHGGVPKESSSISRDDVRDGFADPPESRKGNLNTTAHLLAGTWYDTTGSICSFADDERHLGHVLSALDQWVAFDATHGNKTGTGFCFLGCHASVAAAKRAVEQVFEFPAVKPAAAARSRRSTESHKRRRRNSTDHRQD